MLWCRYIVNWLIVGQYSVKVSRKLHWNLIKNCHVRWIEFKNDEYSINSNLIDTYYDVDI
jgi:hypothetical protein